MLSWCIFFVLWCSRPLIPAGWIDGVWAVNTPRSIPMRADRLRVSHAGPTFDHP